MKKILDDKTIDEIRKRKASGETDMKLAMEYHVHYKTIQNYCKGVKKDPKHRQYIMSRFTGVR